MTLIVAHRGLHVSERENTVAAFRAARALGVDGVELDVRLSADGVLVVHHDAHADAVAIGRSPARDLPDFVPTLAQALDAAEGLVVNVEIKNLRHASEATYDESGDFARQVVNFLHEARAPRSVIVSCFDLATCQVVRDHDPLLRVGWLLSWRHAVGPALERAADLGLDAVHPPVRRVHAATAQRARALGLALNVWTVNEPNDLSAMLALEVASVITDDPATALTLAGRAPV